MPLPNKNRSIKNRKSAKELVYDSLSQWIIDGTLKPGEKLMDSEIATLFSVSRTPVREALLTLESQNLVDVIPGKATVVSSFDLSSIKTLYEAIACININALTIAFPKIDDGIIYKLNEINNRFLSTINSENIDLIRATDKEFHQVFFDLANNSYLNSFEAQLNIHSIRAENMFFKLIKKVEYSYQTHNQIIECLKSRDLESAKRALYSNWMGIADIEHISFDL